MQVLIHHGVEIIGYTGTNPEIARQIRFQLQGGCQDKNVIPYIWLIVHILRNSKLPPSYLSYHGRKCGMDRFVPEKGITQPETPMSEGQPV